MLSPSDMVVDDKEGEGREWLGGCVQGLAWGATLNQTLFQGFRKRFPNNPTTAHPMPICKSKTNPNNYLPEISVILPTLLLLPTTLRECLPFVHLGNLFWSSRIIRVLIIPDPNEPREPERDAAFVHLIAEKISKARKSAVRIRTTPCAAVYIGLKLKSAVRTSHTTFGSNQISGLAPPTLTSPLGISVSSGWRVSQWLFSISSLKPVPILQMV